MHRYTMKELDTWNDLQVIRRIIYDRQCSLTNRYAPLNQRLERILDKIDKKQIIEIHGGLRQGEMR